MENETLDINYEFSHSMANARKYRMEGLMNSYKDNKISKIDFIQMVSTQVNNAINRVQSDQAAEEIRTDGIDANTGEVVDQNIIDTIIKYFVIDKENGKIKTKNILILSGVSTGILLGTSYYLKNKSSRVIGTKEVQENNNSSAEVYNHVNDLDYQSELDRIELERHEEEELKYNNMAANILLAVENKFDTKFNELKKSIEKNSEKKAEKKTVGRPKEKVA